MRPIKNSLRPPLGWDRKAEAHEPTAVRVRLVWRDDTIEQRHAVALRRVGRRVLVAVDDASLATAEFWLSSDDVSGGS